jgi:hypothetical protein
MWFFLTFSLLFIIGDLSLYVKHMPSRISKALKIRVSAAFSATAPLKQANFRYNEAVTRREQP